MSDRLLLNSILKYSYTSHKNPRKHINWKLTSNIITTKKWHIKPIPKTS
jgi:hypothetical protein